MPNHEQLMREMGVDSIVNSQNTPASNDQSQGGGQQVIQNNAETTPVETQTQNPPVETPPVQEGAQEGGTNQTTNTQGEENNTSATPESTPQNDAEGEKKEPEVNPLVKDFFSEESEDPAQNSTGTPPATQQTPVQPPVAQTTQNTFPADFFDGINKEFGTEYKDQTSFVDGYRKLQAQAKLMDDFGVDPVMLQAIQEGILTQEEIATGGLLFEYGKDLTHDDIVSDMLLESNPNMTQEELEDALEEMGAGQKIGLATQYANMKNMQRQMRADELQSRLNAKKQAREQEALEIKRQKDLMASEVNKSIAAMTDVAGTGLKVDAKMKQQIGQVANNPDMIRQLLWGRGENPDPAFFVQQVSRLMYAAKIANLANTQGKNEARRDLIQSTQNLDRNNNSAGMVRVEKSSAAQEGLEAANKFFNS